MDSPVETWKVDTRSIRSTAKLGDSAEITIDNPWGDIRVRNHELVNSVLVQAAIQELGAEPWSGPELRVDESLGRFQLEVLFPDAQISPRTGRVDLVAYVPKNASLVLQTADGLLQAKKTANSIRAESASGSIEIINDGMIRAHSGSGRILARPVSPGWKEMDLTSESGTISAFIPGDRPLSLVASGQADTRSGLPLEQRGNQYLLARGPQKGLTDRVRIETGGRFQVMGVDLRPDRPQEKP